MADGIELKGLEELSEKLQKVVKQYPDKAEEKLVSLGRDLRKKVKLVTPDSGKIHKSKLNKSYKLSQVKQTGSNLFIEFWSNAPHFHLIERGHYIVNKKGERKGWVDGKFMVETTVKKMEEDVPKELENWLDDVLKELD